MGRTALLSRAVSVKAFLRAREWCWERRAGKQQAPLARTLGVRRSGSSL